jgi:hypothetical protein
MRKSIVMLVMGLATLCMPGSITASPTEPVPVTATNPESAERAKVLLARLDEIKAMDKSQMTRTEKKVLRKEVRAIKSELRASNNGVYLSVGAIIIIILLLILLL